MHEEIVKNKPDTNLKLLLSLETLKESFIVAKLYFKKRILDIEIISNNFFICNLL